MENILSQINLGLSDFSRKHGVAPNCLLLGPSEFAILWENREIFPSVKSHNNHNEVLGLQIIETKLDGVKVVFL